MITKNNTSILDCTIRDGGYINNWHFEKKMVRDVYRALSKTGVDFVELGFRTSEKYFNRYFYGPYRFTSEKDLLEIVEGIKGPKISIMGDYGKFDIEDIEDEKNSVASMVRIAANKDKVFDAIKLLEKIKNKGYITSLQAMGCTGYTENEKNNLIAAIKVSALDYIYIADSYGSLFPHEIEKLFVPFLEIGTVKVGFHPHNSLQMAFANTLEAIRKGISIVDGSIYGMGRGSGNLPTEVLVAYLEVNGNKKYNVLPILNCIDRYFVGLMKETPWGYQLPYMISGMFKCHPYYAAELINRREYSIEDVWRALEIIDEMAPVGYDRAIVEKLIRNGVVGGSNGTYINMHKMESEDTDEEKLGPVQYIGRHEGREFLVLANGPTLKKYHGEVVKFIKKYDPIVLGANYLSGLFEPNYHAFNNKKRFAMYVDTVSSRSNLLIGNNISKEMITEYVNREHEILFFKNVLDVNFAILNGKIQTNCRTISVLLIGVSIVMGAQRVFVAGMDGYLTKNDVIMGLFYDESQEPEDHDLIVERHRWNERFLSQIDGYLQDRAQEGIHIITPTSHQRFYKGIENYI